MTSQFNLITCGCGHSFGSTNMKVNYCTKCGSSINIKNIERFDDAEALSSAVSFANIPKEISKELTLKIKRKESKQKSNSKLHMPHDWSSAILSAKKSKFLKYNKMILIFILIMDLAQAYLVYLSSEFHSTFWRGLIIS